MADSESFAVAVFGISNVGTLACLPQRWLDLSTSVSTPRRKEGRKEGSSVPGSPEIVFFFNILLRNTIVKLSVRHATC